MKIFEFELRDMEEDILTIVLDWRNRPEIRNMMFNSEPISWEQHINWYHNAINNNSSIPKVLFFKSEPIGVAVFNDLNLKSKSSAWSFYISNSSKYQGTGTILGYLALQYFFSELNYEFIYGEVLEYNEASVKFHEKLGFEKHKVLSQKISKGKTCYEVYQYKLSKEQWINNSERIKTLIIKKFGR